MDATTWNRIVASFPDTHLLQSWEWGEFKSNFGWQPLFKIWGSPNRPEAAALVLQRSLSMGGFADRLRVLYVPKGPLLRHWEDEDLRHQVLEELRNLAHQQRAIFIKIDPDVRVGTGVPGTSEGRVDPAGSAVLNDLQAFGWRFSGEQIQFRNTVWVDLNATEEQMLARMKQKTRYNIRLAQRKGVIVRPGTLQDLGLLYRMYAETSLRDGFTIRDETYYQKMWEIFWPKGKGGTPFCLPLIAEVEGEPVAAVVLFVFAGKAYYLQGMSRPIHRNKMPNYLLQWEAMRRARLEGCQVYDLWGAPVVFDESDPMWGVFRFKQGFGGTAIRTIGAYDLPVQRVLYPLYTRALPRLLDILRKRGSVRVRHSVQDAPRETP